MKAILCVVLCVLSVILICSCGGSEVTVPSAPAPAVTPDVPAETPPPVSEDAPDEAPEVSSHAPKDASDTASEQPPAPLSEEIATALLLHYAEEMKEGYEKGHIYLHLGDFEFAREFMITFPEKMLELIIEETTRINDYLFEFLILIEWDLEWPGMYVREYYYVGVVDGIPFVMINQYGVPEELMENFNTEKYELYYSSEHIDDTRPREHNGKKVVEFMDPDW